jgi:hypothetical protein
MDNSFTYTPQLSNPDASVSLDNWNTCISQYEKQNYLNAFKYLLLYVNSKLDIPDGNFSIKVPHGSVVLEINANSKNFSIKAPFIQIPESVNALPILRQILELNFSYLLLSKIIAKGNEFYFIFEDSIENCEPYKIYAVLEEICYGADHYDDFFIEKYNAQFIQKPDLQYFSDEKAERAHSIFQSVIKEAIQYCDYFDSKRYYYQSCDVLATTFTRIDYIMAPQGILKIDLNKVYNEMFEEDSTQNIATKIKTKLAKFLDYDKTKFKESMFTPNFLIPLKKRAELPLIQDELRNTHTNGAANISSGALMAACLSMTFAIYNILYRYRVPEKIEKFFNDSLARSAGLPWEKSARILYDTIDKVMRLDKISSIEPSGKSSESSTSSVVKSVMGKIFSIFK